MRDFIILAESAYPDVPLTEAMKGLDGLALYVGNYSASQYVGDIADPRSVIVLFNPKSLTVVATGKPYDLDGTHWIVGSVKTRHGYGPLLYAIIATLLSKHKGILIASEDRSTAALAMWERFGENPYVEIVPVKKSPTGFGIAGNGTLDLSAAIALGEKVHAKLGDETYRLLLQGAHERLKKSMGLLPEAMEPTTGVLPATPENIARAKRFVLQKWQERAAENGKQIPTDLSYSCKFSSMFAQRIFGGQIRGNEHHQYVVLDDGKVLDLNVDADDVKELLQQAAAGELRKGNWGAAYYIRKKTPYFHDGDFFGKGDHRKSMQSCAPRVEQWVAEFAGKTPSKGLHEEVSEPAWLLDGEPYEARIKDLTLGTDIFNARLAFMNNPDHVHGNTAPVMVTMRDGKPYVLDGYHRLVQAERKRQDTIMVQRVVRNPRYDPDE